ncbi:MAG: DNA repair protein RecN [Ktedonobacterales bacterium]
MLLELTISNFAIIDQLQLTLGPRFNVFTGETGAGKSIILDAVSALLGERVTSDVVRSGCERATIEGVFDISAQLKSRPRAAPLPVQPAAATHDAPEAPESPDDLPVESLSEVLEQLGIECEDGVLILTREMLATGRSIARVNRRAAPISSLQNIARFLVDIHGQSAHLELLHPEQHIRYLDRYAGTAELEGQVAALYGDWRQTRRDLERLRRDEGEMERRIGLLRYQVDEITAARLTPGEWEELEGERRRLANAERLGELSAAIHSALSGDSDTDVVGAIDQSEVARRALGDLLRLDDALREQELALEQALFLLQDVALSVRSYQDEIAADPRRQAEVEERLDQISKLRRKYGATVEEVLAYAGTASLELEELTHREERTAEMEEQEQQLKRQIGSAAGELSRKRHEASVQLAAAMEQELDDLNMLRARFQVRMLQQPDTEGAPVPAAVGKASAAKTLLPAGSYVFGPTGIDTVEFLLAPNPGESLKPLARIASGGETSRLMLALKTILARADMVPTLIFDEIDSGISGRSGQIVGEKLWQLGRSHQILCVTHLPQIAALGDGQYQVIKVADEKHTRVEVRELSAQERIRELAQMLGGSDTRASRANAGELIERGRNWKETQAQTYQLA